MSDYDSFLDEVTEEVRRDRMIGFLRRNAIWIAAAVILIVGGASAWEWRKAQARAEAEARGAALWAALEAEDPAAQAAALDGIDMAGSGDGAALLALHRAAIATQADDREAAVAALREVAGRADVSPALRDVARLKLVGAGHGIVDAEERLDILQQLTAEGHALRALALEQQALIRLEQGDVPGAVADFRAIGEDPRAGADVRDRAQRLVVVLGGDEVREDG
ncbi:tetratricopeptide repeat protein [Rhodobacteraceae bacterium 2CG4]|uniref:Tetratricopeptide repeat protein n=1 Tax=Halovulum marinum TaxID=2662447 RepID=A0A6L5YYL4_9RHOB|nr:tetratricopeptide repeat protein [Halovulum marinum]MSU88972.1 tetratricopeptide repeat protein [Halovulum marinum]